MDNVKALFKQYRNFLIIGGVGLVAVIMVVMMMGSRSDTTGAPAGPRTSGGLTQEQLAFSQQIERELLAELLNLRSITLDDSLFAEPTFLSLIDFTRPIEPQPVGRENPFAPLESIPGVARRGGTTTADILE